MNWDVFPNVQAELLYLNMSVCVCVCVCVIDRYCTDNTPR